jgi:hypothetical protein
MDFLTLIQQILRVLSVTLAVIVGILYILAQLFQRMPQKGFRLQTYDYIVYGSVLLLTALGFNSYWGALAFLPLLFWKFAARFVFTPSKIRGKGRWLELRWSKLSPRGFQQLPRDMVEQMNRELSRIPKDTHFLLPRPVALWAIRYLLKKTQKDAAKHSIPQLKGREKETFGKLEEMANGVINLEVAKSKTINLPFGVLHVSRL